MPAPATSSRHLYTGHRRGHIQAAPRLRAHRSGPLSRDHPQIPVSMPSLFRFDASAVVHTCSSSHRTPAPLTARRLSMAALTTPALDRRSLRWFGVSACTATPQDLPPSLAQHGSCRRSSTSSSLPFRTHVGARNGVVAGQAACRRVHTLRGPESQPLQTTAARAATGRESPRQRSEGAAHPRSASTRCLPRSRERTSRPRGPNSSCLPGRCSLSMRRRGGLSLRPVVESRSFPASTTTSSPARAPSSTSSSTSGASRLPPTRAGRA